MQDQKIAPTENPDRPPEVTASQVNALLPQTQCRQCGFNACLPYAQAIACGEAPINRCPPGGQSGIQKLAALTGLAEIGLDPAFGSEHKRRLAWIDPTHCIGCTLCIQACPVDAIIGASKAMHAVIASHCTGCELCVAPCPVDCIEMRSPHTEDWTRSDAIAAQQRFEQRTRRVESSARQSGELRKRSIIAAAVAKARERLAASARTASEKSNSS